MEEWVVMVHSIFGVAGRGVDHGTGKGGSGSSNERQQ